MIQMIAFVALTFAHGGGEHFMGSAKAVDAKTITVATTDAKEVVVQVDASTRFEKGKTKVTLADVRVGARLVVHAKRDGEVLRAQLVRLAE